MIIHIPHASRVIPDSVRGAILLDDGALELELLRMTDAYTDELFQRADSSSVVFPISRLIVDPERFINDDEESMSSRGMAVIYTRTAEGKVLRNAPMASERRSLLSQYYVPHHDQLVGFVSVELAGFGNAVVVDCHSFPSAPLPASHK